MMDCSHCGFPAELADDGDIRVWQHGDETRALCTDCLGPKTSFDDLEALIYNRPSGGCGCCLHIVLDDGNIQDASVQLCLDIALRDGHDICARVAQRFLEASVHARALQLFGGWCPACREYRSWDERCQDCRGEVKRLIAPAPEIDAECRALMGTGYQYHEAELLE